MTPRRTGRERELFSRSISDWKSSRSIRSPLIATISSPGASPARNEGEPCVVCKMSDFPHRNIENGAKSNRFPTRLLLHQLELVAVEKGAEGIECQEHAANPTVENGVVRDLRGLT